MTSAFNLSLEFGFVLFALSTAAPSLVLAENAVGDWGGVLGGELNLILHVTQDADGTYHGVAESPDQTDTKIPVDTVLASERELSFSIEALDARYEAVWDDTQKAWVGTFTQGDELPLVLKRLDEAAIAAMAPIRPQEAAIAAGPVPYVQEDVSFENVAVNVTLAGTFVVPDGEGPFPAVVLIAGSGPNTRNEELMGHKVFLVLADALARQGIASVRYDKRGVGESTGDYEASTTEEFISDAAAALEWVRNRPDVDAARVFLVGHSEGGTIAPAVAVDNPGLAGIVLLAGPSVRGYDILLSQARLIGLADGDSETEVAANDRTSRIIYDAVLNADSIEQAVKLATDAIVPEVAAGAIPVGTAMTKIKWSTSPWLFHFLRYDPAPTLKKVDVPVLALFGSLDLQVPPMDNIPPIQQATVANADVTVTLLPGLNHLFQTATTGSPNEYGEIEETMSPVALAAIADWIAARSQ